MLNNQLPATSNKPVYAAIAVLAINHLIGVMGLFHPFYSETFAKLSWINLLLSFVIVLGFHQRFTIGLILSLLFAFTLGMAVEAVGVATGFPFGTYAYSHLFGPSVFKVPVIIGINWALLSYCTAHLAVKFTHHTWLGVFLGALFMTLLDVLLEPFAIRHGFWSWDTFFPPLQNFTAWFVVSLPIQWLMNKHINNTTNRLALPYLLVLVLFLVADWLLAKLV